MNHDQDVATGNAASFSTSAAWPEDLGLTSWCYDPEAPVWLKRLCGLARLMQQGMSLAALDAADATLKALKEKQLSDLEASLSDLLAKLARQHLDELAEKHETAPLWPHEVDYGLRFARRVGEMGLQVDGIEKYEKQFSLLAETRKRLLKEADPSVSDSLEKLLDEHLYNRKIDAVLEKARKARVELFDPLPDDEGAFRVETLLKTRDNKRFIRQAEEAEKALKESSAFISLVTEWAQTAAPEVREALRLLAGKAIAAGSAVDEGAEGVSDSKTHTVVSTAGGGTRKIEPEERALLGESPGVGIWSRFARLGANVPLLLIAAVLVILLMIGGGAIAWQMGVFSSITGTDIDNRKEPTPAQTSDAKEQSKSLSIQISNMPEPPIWIGDIALFTINIQNLASADGVTVTYKRNGNQTEQGCDKVTSPRSANTTKTTYRCGPFDQPGKYTVEAEVKSDFQTVSDDKSFQVIAPELNILNISAEASKWKLNEDGTPSKSFQVRWTIQNKSSDYDIPAGVQLICNQLDQSVSYESESGDFQKDQDNRLTATLEKIPKGAVITKESVFMLSSFQGQFTPSCGVQKGGWSSSSQEVTINPPPPAPASIEIEPASPIELGHEMTRTLTAIVKDNFDQPMQEQGVTWKVELSDGAITLVQNGSGSSESGTKSDTKLQMNTNENGEASVTVQATGIGTGKITATIGDLPSSSVEIFSYPIARLKEKQSNVIVRSQPSKPSKNPNTNLMFTVSTSDQEPFLVKQWLVGQVKQEKGHWLFLTDPDTPCRTGWAWSDFFKISPQSALESNGLDYSASPPQLNRVDDLQDVMMPPLQSNQSSDSIKLWVKAECVEGEDTPEFASDAPDAIMACWKPPNAINKSPPIDSCGKLKRSDSFSFTFGEEEQHGWKQIVIQNQAGGS